MKEMLIVLAIVMATLSLAGEVGGAPIIIDHTCTDLSKIPLPWLEAAKTNLRISYRHSSHGSQLVTGIFGISDTMGAPYNFSYYTGATFEPGYFLTDGFPKGADDLGGASYWKEPVLPLVPRLRLGTFRDARIETARRRRSTAVSGLCPARM